MYKETAQSKTKTSFLVFSAIVLSVVLIVITGYIPKYRVIYQLVALGVLSAGVYALIRYNLYIYEYHITESELIFTARLGSGERVLANVPFDFAEYVAPYGHSALKETAETFRYNAKKSFSNKGAYVLVFTDNKRRYSKLTFEPSEKFLQKLSEAGIKIIK